MGNSISWSDRDASDVLYYLRLALIATLLAFYITIIHPVPGDFYAWQAIAIGGAAALWYRTFKG